MGDCPRADLRDRTQHGAWHACLEMCQLLALSATFCCRFYVGQEIQVLQHQGALFLEVRSVDLKPKNTPETPISSRMWWRIVSCLGVIWLALCDQWNNKNNIPSALGVLFSEAVLEGGFREVLVFATWNFFLFKKTRTSDDEAGQKPGLGRHRHSNRSWKPPTRW